MTTGIETLDGRAQPAGLDPVDRQIILATQAGLPLVLNPYVQVAKQLGLTTTVFMLRLRRMQELGIIRRIAAVPNHYALGCRANGMSVWDVPDDEVSHYGQQVGSLDFVSHCFRCSRTLPDWPYNLFAMVHGGTREEVMDKVARIADLLGDAGKAHEVLFSTRIVKKTGLRLKGE